MISRNNFLKMEEDAGRRLVFVCCLLFFFVVSISSLLSKRNSGNSSLHLSQSSPGSLVFSKIPDKSVTLPHFTPFFFKAIPINSCDKNLLVSVSGIGPSLADSIIKTRKQVGYFSGMQDLLFVPGIGRLRMIKFSKFFSFEKSSSVR